MPKDDIDHLLKGIGRECRMVEYRLEHIAYDQAIADSIKTILHLVHNLHQLHKPTNNQED